MNESFIKINSTVLKGRIEKALILIQRNRERIYSERLMHCLYEVNQKNKRNSKKWWSFLIPSKFKKPVSESQLPTKLKNKMKCLWGKEDTLKKLLTLCVIGYDVSLNCEDMKNLLEAEKANSWQSGASKRTPKDVQNIWS